MTFAVGERLPPVTFALTDGTMLDLSRPGQPIVLFFFPKANTPGCTSEARDFAAAAPAFAAKGVRVVGVSRDGAAVLARFGAKHAPGLPFASDADGVLTDALGLWAEKSLYGRTFMGIVRTTLLADADGTIVRIWPRVRVAGHVDAVLSAIDR